VASGALRPFLRDQQQHREKELVVIRLVGGIVNNVMVRNGVRSVAHAACTPPVLAPAWHAARMACRLWQANALNAPPA